MATLKIGKSIESCDVARSINIPNVSKCLFHAEMAMLCIRNGERDEDDASVFAIIHGEGEKKKKMSERCGCCAGCSHQQIGSPCFYNAINY